MRTWHWWLVRKLTVYAGACACSEEQAREWVVSVRGCTASTTDRCRVAGVGERPHVCARERACKLMNDSALASPGGMTARRVTPQLAAAKRRRAQPGRGTERKRVGLLPFPSERVRVRGCTGVWICVRVPACTCRGHDHGDGTDNGVDATNGENKRRNKEESVTPQVFN
jgi:hypothetical protein